MGAGFVCVRVADAVMVWVQSLCMLACIIVLFCVALEQRRRGCHICSNAIEGWLEGKGRVCVC